MPTPPGTDEETKRLFGGEMRELAQLVVAPDERRERLGDRAPRRVRSAWGAARDRGASSDRVLREDRGLEPAQLRPRLESELLGEDVAAVLEDAQRVGLPPGAVQRRS